MNEINGYELAEKMIHKIGNNDNHEMSVEDALNVISFWGFNEESSKSTRIGFACYCARLTIKKTLEKALVWGDYKMYDQMKKYIEEDRKAVENEDN